MNQSQKHHFLPVFYIKGFTNENEEFKIFNVKSKNFKQKGKYFYPSSHFYILKDNTITTDYGESDFMEKLYEKIDNDFAQILHKIKTNNYDHRFGVDESYMPYINNFVSQIYWRSPFNKKIIQDYIKKFKLKELGIKIVDGKGNYNEN